ncbi:uncharacterized protein LOC129240947 [Anastrepha obliqua]|uniref:uncharacterized protein LOC128860472 n=1 Tax=Anastrepha ludens TaxID=28586 RepID=UPI0023B19C8F|nr:uncharacterized protein LOC128860472 [Anastrepha ludens]XP_054733001.1 uncharacterized protein LOC129240947 [Anastrepha obliqua]
MEFRHQPFQYPGTCSLKEQIDGVEHTLLYLGNRIRGLEDALENPNIDPTLRIVIKEEILALKADVDKYKQNVKALHKDKSKQMTVITILIFIILSVFTLYRLFYSWY